MAKKTLSVFPVASSDWMKYRPYPSFRADYDAPYLKLANEIYKRLSDPNGFLFSLIGRSYRVDLAVVLASWVEDRISEMGIWRAFVHENMKRFGYWLPFFPMKGYDPDYMNTEDVAFIILHYVYVKDERWLLPDDPVLHQLSNQILMEAIEPACDDLPLADYGDKLLDVPDDIDFFDLKNRLAWFSLKNYFLGAYFAPMLAESFQNLAQKPAGKFFGGDYGKMLYMLQNDYLFGKNSHYLALNTCEWFALVARGSDSVRKDIAEIGKKIMGMFIYEGQEGDFFVLSSTQTKAEFRVNAMSIEISQYTVGNEVFTTLVNWKGEWWVTGIMADFGQPSVKNRQSAQAIMQMPFWAWPEGKQQLMREMAQDNEACFLEFFGDRMAFFISERALNRAIGELTGYTNKRLREGGAITRYPHDTSVEAVKQMPDGTEGLALFFEPGVGYAIVPGAVAMVKLMMKERLSGSDQSELFFWFFDSCPMSSARYLLEKIPTNSLKIGALIPDKIELGPHLEFLLRMMNPGEFAPKVPLMTLVNSGPSH